MAAYIERSRKAIEDVLARHPCADEVLGKASDVTKV